MERTRPELSGSTPVAVALSFLINGVIGFAGGYFLAGAGDPNRERLALVLGLFLGLMGVSSTYRRRETNANGIHHEALSALIVFLIVGGLMMIFG